MLCTFPLLMKRYPKNCDVTLVFLLQLNKRFNLSFLNVHGKLFTKVGCVLEVQYIYCILLGIITMRLKAVG